MGKTERNYYRARRDFRSSINGLRFAKSTDKITYAWRNLNVSAWVRNEVRNAGGDDVESGSCSGNKSETNFKEILHNVTGFVRPGELLAIMGASGAGKSTLLNVLNFRNIGKLRVSGERTVNGVPVGPDSLTAVSAYIQQDDLFIGSLTVREHLVFQALVRMHSHIPYKLRIQRVEEVIQELGLSKCAETQIGIPGRIKGISGGEMKRLSFASEILTDPPLMFCDEPTSGLDSFMSSYVISILKNLAGAGKTILCTIHQPSSQIFQMFDRLLLMSEGRVAFMGKTTKAITFFKKNGFVCPEHYNPSDFFIETLAIQQEDETESRNRVIKICNSYEESEDNSKIQKYALRKRSNPEAEAYLKNEGKLHCDSPYKASWFKQFSAVLWRSWISNIRDPMFIRIKFFQSLVMSLTIGLIFFGQKANQNGVHNITGANFNVMMNLSYGIAAGTAHVFSSELSLFLREHFNGMYRSDVYFLSKMLAEFPFYVIFPFMTALIVYFMVGFQTSPYPFLMTAGIYILVANCAVSTGYFVSCICATAQVGATLAPALIVPFVVVGGLFMASESIPSYLIWLKYISWFHYGNEAITIAQWKDIEGIDIHSNNLTCSPIPISNGTILIKTLGFKESHLVLDVMALLGIAFVIRLLAYLALLKRTFRKAKATSLK